MKASFKEFQLSLPDTECLTDPSFDNSLFDKETGLQAASISMCIESTPVIWLWTADKASRLRRQINDPVCVKNSTLDHRLGLSRRHCIRFAQTEFLKRQGKEK
jgi:hypothetical protein